MKKDNSQVINTVLICIGGGILIYVIADEGKDNVYLLILGIVLLMYGLYKATNHWVYTKDEFHDDDEKEDPKIKKEDENV